MTVHQSTRWRVRVHDRLAFAAGLIALVLIMLLLALQLEYPIQTAGIIFSQSMLGVAALTSLLASIVPARGVRFVLLVVAAITSGVMAIYVFPVIVMILTMISAARTLLSVGWTLEALTATVLSAGVAGLLVSWVPDISWPVSSLGVFVVVGGWQNTTARTDIAGWLADGARCGCDRSAVRLAGADFILGLTRRKPTRRRSGRPIRSSQIGMTKTTLEKPGRLIFQNADHNI